jgi:hypothetical protein
VASPRILVLDLPNLVSDMVASAAESRAVRVLGPPRSSVEIEREVLEHDPEFVIVGLDNHRLPAGAREFLAERAKVRLLGIETVEGHAYLYELKPDRIALGSVTPGELLDAIESLSAPEAAA